ncbi:hypothetical protein BN2476_760018 [Paraburkholderia piptadeniae]|uniref:Uncharacterized protein n=1 Tax=Paraburkholderia piptadeniae TaxID=1701573 RepID=A0A1N7SS73_9BURK|nr:hypothetical protein BN2476_760018 [Paraburkholderia piptadeniae]
MLAPDTESETLCLLFVALSVLRVLHCCVSYFRW